MRIPEEALLTLIASSTKRQNWLCQSQLELQLCQHALNRILGWMLKCIPSEFVGIIKWCVPVFDLVQTCVQNGMQRLRHALMGNPPEAGIVTNSSDG